MIWNAIMKLVWFLFVQCPLSLIAAFSKVLEYLTGGIINDILFGSAKDFQWNNIPIQFWWFVIIAFCIFSLVFTIQMIVLMFNEATKAKTKFVLAIQNGVKAFIFMFLIPIFFFLANFIIQNLANTIINNFGNNSNIAQYLWHIGDPTWDGTANRVPDDYSFPDNINQYNMLAQIFGTWFMLFAVFMIGIILVQKIIELFFLFVISPIVMVVMVVDDGKAAFTWKDMVGAKFLASTGTLIGYYIFISVTQILLSSDLNGLAAGNFSKSLFIILYLCGGGLATMGFSDMIAHFVGESAGIREGLNSFRSTVAGGMMAMGATKMASRAIGFAKSKRAQKDIYGSALNSNYDDASDIESKQGLNFASFINANKGLSSRAGIIGLAGLALGATAIGFSNFKVGKKLGGVRIGMKHFGRSLGKAVASPVKVVGETFNPGLVKFSKTKITQDHRKFKEYINTDTKNSKEDSQLIQTASSLKRTKRIEKNISKLDTSEKKLKNNKNKTKKIN
ncbi:MAG: Mbov_0396 family ICE element transmembrane protein [Spiroplasma sp.]